MTENIVLDKQIIDDSKNVACKIENSDDRKRVYALNVAANAVESYLDKNGFSVNKSANLYKIPAFSKNLEIADIYVDEKRLDVRVTFDENVFYIPKVQEKYDAEPVAYLVTSIDSALENVKILGFVSSKELSKQSANEYYCFESSILKPIDELQDFLDNEKIEKNVPSPDILEKVNELVVSFIDDEISDSEKVYFIKNVVKYNACREILCDLSKFDSAAAQVSSYSELLNDSTLSVLSGNTKEIDEALLANLATVENAEENISVDELVLEEDNQTAVPEEFTEELELDMDQIEALILESEEPEENASAVETDVENETEVEVQENENEDIAEDIALEELDSELLQAGEEEIIKPMSLLSLEEETVAADEEPLLADEQVVELKSGEDTQLDVEELSLTEEIPSDSEVEEKDDLLIEAHANDIELTESDELAVDELLLAAEGEDAALHEHLDNEELFLDNVADLLTEDENEITLHSENELEDLVDLHENTIESEDLSIVEHTEDVLDSSESLDVLEESTDMSDLVVEDEKVSEITEDNALETEESAVLENDDLTLVEEDKEDLQEEAADSKESLFDDLTDLVDESSDSDVSNVDSDNSQINSLLDDDLLSLLSEDGEENIETQAEEQVDDCFEGADSEDSVCECCSVEADENVSEEIDSESNVSDEITKEGDDSIEALFDTDENSEGLSEKQFELDEEPISEKAVNATKNIIILLTFLLLLAGGGLAAWFTNHSKVSHDNAIDAANQDNEITDMSNNGEDDKKQPALSQDINKSMTNSFSETPAAITITKLSWQVSEKLAAESSVKEYLQTAGKNIQINLQNDLANSADVNFNNSIKVSFELAQDNTMKGIQILESSGSDQVDEIVVRSIKNTLKYVRVPKINNFNSDFFLTLIINF